MKKNQKSLLTTIILVAIILCVAISGIVYKYNASQLYGNNGIYHTQQETGEYLQFKKDKTFSYAYNPQNDKSNPSNIQAEILGHGTWKKSGNKITLTFTDSDEKVILIEKDKYIYKEDKVFRGKTSDSKLLNNKYLLEIDEERSESIWFFDDGSVSHEVCWGADKTIKNGKYTRTDDILTVRYSDKTASVERYLVLDNGITKDIYSKELPR